MMKIKIPTNNEILQTLQAADNEMELTDRELWILSELECDEE